MKKTTRFVLLAVMLLVAVVVFNPNAKYNVKRYIKNNNAELTSVAENLLSENISVNSEYNGWKLDFFSTSDTPVVQFTVKSGGIVPSSGYKGFYYSPEDVPIGFQGIETEFIADGDRWLYSYEGDNQGFTEKIIDNWYWFEIIF